MRRSGQWLIMRRARDLRMHIIFNRSSPHRVAVASGVHPTAIGPILSGERPVLLSDAEAIVEAAPGDLEVGDWFEPFIPEPASIKQIDDKPHVLSGSAAREVEPSGRDAILVGRGTR